MKLRGRYLKGGKSVIRVGHGFDVHVFAENRKLMLGGVEIPWEKGLDGHSDADVLIHAICDAVIGALGLGDIGKLYPDNDDRFLNIDSKILLKDTANRMYNMGYEISNVDATVIAQAPKLAPYIDLMKKTVADCIGCGDDKVNIKATTEEHLGFTGRGEGIAAHAVCCIFKN